MIARKLLDIKRLVMCICIHLSIHQSTHTSIHPPIHSPSIHPSIHPIIHLILVYLLLTYITQALKHEKEVSGKLTKQVEHLQKMVAQGKGEAGLSTPVKNEQKAIQELGNKIDEAYSQSLETKEKRIVQLEQRLEELRQENSGLRKRQALKDEFQTTSV